MGVKKRTFFFILATLSMQSYSLGAKEERLVFSKKPHAAPAAVSAPHSEDFSGAKSLPAYNLAAAVDAPIFAKASFIYWRAVQDSMDIAFSQSLTLPSILSRPNGSDVLFAKTDYKPGFKIGVGGNPSFDNWVVSAEYTWLHGSTFTRKTAAPLKAFPNTTGVWNNDWFPNTNNVHSLTAAFKWTYKLDLFDTQLARPYYMGTKVILKPFAGVRAAWIAQKVRATQEDIVYSSGISSVAGSSRVVSHCWGLGPRLGLDGDWFLGRGVHLIGNANASVLFTHFSKITCAVDNVDFVNNPLPTVYGVHLTQKDYNTVRPNANVGLGFGWKDWIGPYFLDLSASYELSVFWSQNMIRSLAQNVTAQGDLLLHGLSANVKFDF